jgi:hypothetical protein
MATNCAFRKAVESRGNRSMDRNPDSLTDLSTFDKQAAAFSQRSSGRPSWGGIEERPTIGSSASRDSPVAFGRWSATKADTSCPSIREPFLAWPTISTGATGRNQLPKGHRVLSEAPTLPTFGFHRTGIGSLPAKSNALTWGGCHSSIR